MATTQFEIWLEKINEDFKKEWQRNLMAFPPESIEQFLNDMIVEKLFLAEARRREIDQDPRFQEEVDNYREQLLVEALQRVYRMLSETDQKRYGEIFAPYLLEHSGQYVYRIKGILL